MHAGMIEILYNAGLNLPHQAGLNRVSAPTAPPPPLASRMRNAAIAIKACQLLLVIAFLALLLERLKETFTTSWFFVFIPLWVSDVITSVAAVVEMRRQFRERADERATALTREQADFRMCALPLLVVAAPGLSSLLFPHKPSRQHCMLP
jgi:hypothetical protein